jgi:hypothetical protein
MSSPLCLAELETCLERLAAPDTFTLSNAEMARIFSKQDFTLERLERFAFEHGCMPVYWQGAVIFEKLASR